MPVYHPTGIKTTADTTTFPAFGTGSIYQRVSDAAGKILKAEMEKTLKLLGENRPQLDAVARALLEKNRLYRKDLEAILPKTSAQAAQH